MGALKVASLAGFQVCNLIWGGKKYTLWALQRPKVTSFTPTDDLFTPRPPGPSRTLGAIRT